MLQALNRNDQLPMLLQGSDSGVIISRMGIYDRWRDRESICWSDPALPQYKSALLEDGKEPSTVRAYVTAAREAYRRVLADRDWLFMQFQAEAQQTTGNRPSFVETQAAVNEFVVRSEIRLQSKDARVSVTEKQDDGDGDHIRLTIEQTRALLASPNDTIAIQCRDALMLTLMICTGVREAEVVGLDFADIYQSLNSVPALRVRHGKGNKQRLIPYGGFYSMVMYAVNQWANLTGLFEGPLLRAFNRATWKNERMGVRSVGFILGSYPVLLQDWTVLNPHDLRRTYARLMYDAGMDVTAIQQNLGHKLQTTTLRYIGRLDATKRMGVNVFATKEKS